MFYDLGVIAPPSSGESEGGAHRQDLALFFPWGAKKGKENRTRRKRGDRLIAGPHFFVCNSTLVPFCLTPAARLL